MGHLLGKECQREWTASMQAEMQDSPLARGAEVRPTWLEHRDAIHLARGVGRNRTRKASVPPKAFLDLILQAVGSH